MGDGGLVGRDLAIDLGTANTVVYREGDGIVFAQPTVVALRGVDRRRDRDRRRRRAQYDGGDSGNVIAMRPLRSGAITEFEVTQRFLAGVLRKTAPGRYPKPRVLICIPSAQLAGRAPCARGGGRRQRRQAGHARRGDARRGDRRRPADPRAGRPPHRGHRRRPVGDGRRVDGRRRLGRRRSGSAGSTWTPAIQEHLRSTYGVAIGETSAEELKLALGSAFPSASGRAALVVGRELATGNTVEVKLDEDELRHAMAEPIGRIIDAARRTLAQAPPELTHDILETGMFLTGGGSLLKGLDLLLAQECEVPVHIAERPLETVAIGAGRMLEHLEEYRSAFQLVRPGGRQ